MKYAPILLLFCLAILSCRKEDTPQPCDLVQAANIATPKWEVPFDQPGNEPLSLLHYAQWTPQGILAKRTNFTGPDTLMLLDPDSGQSVWHTSLFNTHEPGIRTIKLDQDNSLVWQDHLLIGYRSFLHVVDLASGTLESATDLTLFGGANAMAVEAAPGKWEVVQAGAAELIAPGRYRLTRLLRGQRGTEHAIGNPAPAGARVAVLDTTLAPLPIAEADLGLPWNWRVGPAARAVSDDSYAALGFTPTGRGLVPFAPVHVEQPWRTARSLDDLTISWTRRSRALVADAWEQVEVPLAEDLESYDVQILDGTTVKRTLSGSTASVLYTAAQQTADWGAPLGPGQTLALRIYQLSNRLGRGTPAVVTLQF